MTAIETRRERESNCRFLAARKGFELLPVVGVERQPAGSRWRAPYFPGVLMTSV
jgi:hypothetical protein